MYSIQSREQHLFDSQETAAINRFSRRSSMYLIQRCCQHIFDSWKRASMYLVQRDGQHLYDSEEIAACISFK